MLRLTRLAHEGSRTTLLAEGQVVSEWAALLECECAALLRDGQTLHLDLSGVSRVDALGAEVLRRLAAQNVKLQQCTPLIRDMLVESGLQMGDTR